MLVEAEHDDVRLSLDEPEARLAELALERRHAEHRHGRAGHARGGVGLRAGDERRGGQRPQAMITLVPP